jgi:sortase B
MLEKNREAAVNKSSAAKRGAYIYRALMLVLLCVFVLSAVALLRYYNDGKRNEEANGKFLAVAENTISAALTPEGKADYALLFMELKRINPQVTAWLIIDDGVLSYPILQADNNEKYLKTGVDGKYNSHGAVFMDYRNGPFTDFNTIIYGHNMRDDSMFGPLSDIGANLVAKKGIIITLSESGRRVWEVFSARVIDEGDNISLYQPSYSEVQLQKLNASLSPPDLTAEDQILTLSTCTSRLNSDNEYRYIIQARLLGSTPADLPLAAALPGT